MRNLEFARPHMHIELLLLQNRSYLNTTGLPLDNTALVNTELTKHHFENVLYIYATRDPDDRSDRKN